MSSALKPAFLLRLILDGVAAGLLLFALAYYWLGNTAHEVAGFAMFVLLVIHGLLHRRWFAALAKTPHMRRSVFNIAITALLFTGMLVLLATSLAISETLPAGLPPGDDFTVRQIHAGLAYWLLVIVAIHLGLRWGMLMAVIGRGFGVSKPNIIRTVTLRLFAGALGVQGIVSFDALNLRSRLLFQMSLDWWNFENSIAGFFGHCAAFAGLCIFLTYYVQQGQRYWTTRTTA